MSVWEIFKEEHGINNIPIIQMYLDFLYKKGITISINHATYNVCELAFVCWGSQFINRSLIQFFYISVFLPIKLTLMFLVFSNILTKTNVVWPDISPGELFKK